MNKEELKEYERKSYGMENIHKMLLVAMDRLDKICNLNNIHIVKENNNNLKITTPEDYYILKAMLELEESKYVFGI